MDFLKISTRQVKKGGVEVYPKFIVGKSKDLMIRGGDFYAVWLEDRHLWSTDEQDVIDAVDRELQKYSDEYREKYGLPVSTLYMWDSNSGVIDIWHKYVQRQLRDNFHQLDENLMFLNDLGDKESYATKRLPYALENGSTEAWDEMMSVLYSPAELHKIEWAIGCIVTGDSKSVQKFLVLYGGPGTGKSTVLNIIQSLFEGYYGIFDAKALGSANDQFALEVFKSNPLVAIQHDGDLSRIEDNTRLNSLTAHELMTVNEKHKALYSMRFVSFLFMGTNKPVKITDAKSGIIRRLIDVTPTGKKISFSAYNKLVGQIKFELGHIAAKCRDVYLKDPTYYENYVPTNMLGESNDFFNFVEDSYFVFKDADKVTLKEAWEMYKTYCDQAKVPFPFSKRVMKNELKAYFTDFYEDYQNSKDGTHVRNLYSGFKTNMFNGKSDVAVVEIKPKERTSLSEQPSKLDIFCKDCIAQYANKEETPSKAWDNVTTKLSDIETRKLHYVRVPENLIVIDFDIKEDGKKSLERNLEEASKWPKTYMELSKSGCGVHLHYIYDGDVNKLSRIYDDNIEIKVFNGKSSLRRKLTLCNDEDIAHISSGLPMKGDTKTENFDVILNEKALRTIIKRNLNKEYMGATKPSMDFIYKVVEDTYAKGTKYDISDLENAILSFAMGSTNNSEYCVRLVSKMHFKSDDPSDSVDENDKPIIFLDVEVFPNLFLVNWKLQGKDKPVNRLINPTPDDIENLLKYRIVGFNNRRYDNHMLYARLIGKTNAQIYDISKRIVNGDRSAFFGEAYNLSYTDIYDYASKKQSLKKWEIELGIHHQELGLPWDQPVAENLWTKVAEYCDNDVISTEAVWEATQDDFIAREILADIAGMSVNDTTNSLTTRIIFGNERRPQLVYTDLSELFPGYEFKKTYNPEKGTYIRENLYRGVDLGFGGYVYAEPGMYDNVALLDVASLHPHSIIALNLFGEYTKNFSDLVDTRIFIKHKDFDSAKKLFGGKLSKYLTDVGQAKKLSKALKIAINSVYGLTSATFANPFKDPRNENNIVALRGALFMKTLQDEVVARGFTVAHIKTDSIKIPNATPEIIKFCEEFAAKYGYEFEHEATYKKMCLVNNAVYIAKFMTEDECKSLYSYSPEECSVDGGQWTATGTQFQVPYVFKKCFSKEDIVFSDLCEAKEVKTAMYLDYNEEGTPDNKKGRRFVGRVGLFCPIKPGCGGAELVKESKKKDGSVGYDSVVGCKGYRWLEAEIVKGNKENDIDLTYYNALVDEAINTINQYGDYEMFASN